MRRELFENENFYHIYSRGVDRRTIFLEERDNVRFIAALYLFNDAKVRDYDLTSIDLRSSSDLRGLASYGAARKPLVDIIHWSHMPNHFHLLLRQKLDGGISAFMQKIGTSYVMYFNRKHERSGRLFEGPFKAKLVEKDEYFSHLSTYIPLNPVELFWNDWKGRGVPLKDLQKIKERIRRYRWTSLAAYFDRDIVPNLVSKSAFFEVFGGSLKDYEHMIDQYLHRGLSGEFKERLLAYEA